MSGKDQDSLFSFWLPSFFSFVQTVYHKVEVAKVGAMGIHLLLEQSPGTLTRPSTKSDETEAGSDDIVWVGELSNGKQISKLFLLLLYRKYYNSSG